MTGCGLERLKCLAPGFTEKEKLADADYEHSKAPRLRISPVGENLTSRNYYVTK